MDKRETMQQNGKKAILQNGFRGIVRAIMRSGKSRMIVISLNDFDFERALWVTDKVELRDKDIPAELEKWGKEGLPEKVTPICWASLEGHKEKYDVIILDECQKITPKNSSYFHIYKGDFPPILAMTGELSEDWEKKFLLETFLSLGIIFEYGRKEAVEDGVIAPYQINLVRSPLAHKRDVVVTHKKSQYHTSEYQRYAYLNEKINDARKDKKRNWEGRLRIMRQRFLHSLPSKVRIVKNLLSGELKDKRYLIFCPTKKIADLVCDEVYYSNCKKPENLDRFKAGEFDHLAVVDMVSTGVTLKNIDGVIIMGVGNNTNGDISQKFFRSLVFREGYTAQNYILVAKDTVEETDWLPKTMTSLFDGSSSDPVDMVEMEEEKIRRLAE